MKRNYKMPIVEVLEIENLIITQSGGEPDPDRDAKKVQEQVEETTP